MTTSEDRSPGLLRRLGRWALGATLLFTGTGHLTFAREEFQAQVPSWLPLDPDFVVVSSGVVELGLGAALLAARGRWVPVVGWATAGFFVAIFPGNVAQYVEGTDLAGLDNDAARFGRLFFQPVLVGWALWSTAAWRDRDWALETVAALGPTAGGDGTGDAEDGAPTHALRASVRGRVQAVGYRMWTQRTARDLDLDGWVRNEPDGSVTVHAQGERDAVDRLVERLHDGPSWADVTDVVTSAAPRDDDVSSFRIRH